MTKCGRYGPTPEQCDYSPTTIRASVQRSLSRLNTTYLDTVYLHDTEFVSASIGTRIAGDHTTALLGGEVEYGLVQGEEDKIRGEGDQRILDALAELRKMQGEGLIKSVGISGIALLSFLARTVLMGFITICAHRLSAPDAPTSCVARATHAALQAARRSALVFTPHSAKRCLRRVCSASPRARPGPAACHRVPAQHGCAHPVPARVAPRLARTGRCGRPRECGLRRRGLGRGTAQFGYWLWI